ncbi:MAG: hypothetical protein GEU76_01150 [Alphaproteobacteria bacterium]|nr:hypothetical protein [Alphaproteobacteria bacterium]
MTGKKVDRYPNDTDLSRPFISREELRRRAARRLESESDGEDAPPKPTNRKTDAPAAALSKSQPDVRPPGKKVEDDGPPEAA